MPVLLLGVTGGIAAYKAVELTSLLRARGWEVRVVMTEHATRFVTPLTFQTISRAMVHVEAFLPGADGRVEHIELVQGLDLAAVVPATANVLAKLAHGLADDLLSTSLLALRCPLLVAPAMNTHMWQHPATSANLALLRARGVEVIPPQATGELACGELGPGKLAPVPELLAALEARLQRTQDLAGLRVLVTAGGTREPLDPVRFLGNRSSGRMGHALAAAAQARGARVTLVTTVPAMAPSGVTVVPVGTAAELATAVQARFQDCDLLVMAAAVADYRPTRVAPEKLKKQDGPLTLELERTEDVLLSLVPHRRHQLVMGFAAETEELLAHAAAKLTAKGLDWIVANDVSRGDIGFEAAANEVTVLGADGRMCQLPRAPKERIADALLDLVAARRAAP